MGEKYITGSQKFDKLSPCIIQVNLHIMWEGTLIAESIMT